MQLNLNGLPNQSVVFLDPGINGTAIQLIPGSRSTNGTFIWLIQTNQP
jgi:hypothetical protein